MWKPSLPLFAAAEPACLGKPWGKRARQPSCSITAPWCRSICDRPPAESAAQKHTGMGCYRPLQPHQWLKANTDGLCCSDSSIADCLSLVTCTCINVQHSLMHGHVDSLGCQIPLVMRSEQWRDQQHCVQPTYVKHFGHSDDLMGSKGGQEPLMMRGAGDEM